MTNLATSCTKFCKSLLIVGTAATVQDKRAHSSFSASALFSERLRGAACSVKRDIIASLSLHTNIAKITAQELSYLVLCILFDFTRLNTIIN